MTAPRPDTLNGKMVCETWNEDFKGEKVALIGRFFGKWLPPGAQAIVRPAGERYDLLQGGVTTANIDPFELMYDTFWLSVTSSIICSGDILNALSIHYNRHWLHNHGYSLGQYNRSGAI
jgi:hypothetical protein